MTERKPKAPTGLGKRGRRFWARTVADCELSDTELELLVEVCRCLDVADDLQAVIADEGVTASGSTGQRVVHPAVVELRLVRLSLGRQLAQLALPDEEEETVDSPATVRARHAAQSRWRRQDDLDKRRQAKRAEPGGQAPA